MAIKSGNGFLKISFANSQGITNKSVRLPQAHTKRLEILKISVQAGDTYILTPPYKKLNANETVVKLLHNISRENRPMTTNIQNQRLSFQ